MKELVAAVANQLPQELKNAYLIKRQNIYIPYYEVGIECLTKEVTEINLFFETILKLISIGVSDIYEVSTIMGLEFKLLKEVIVDMIEQNYIITSENKLIMTPKGRKALSDRKLVTIRKSNINEITINMITGDIEDGWKNKISKPDIGEICLNEEIIITKNFLENNYTSINRIYQKSQIEINVFNMKDMKRELYKILDITYEKLYYIKHELLVYKNNDSGDYEFIIKDDIGEKYLNCFYRQVRDVVYSGMENFFEKDWIFSQNHYNEAIVSLSDRQYTQKLIEKLNGKDMISDDLLEDYKHARSLIDNKELEILFSHNKKIDYDGMIISCERFKKLLNSEIISTLNQINKKNIWILYDSNEYNIKEFLVKKLDSKRKEMNILEKIEDEDQFICFYPNILVEFVEKTEKVFNKPFTVFEGRIEFDSDIIKNKMCKIITKYNISFSFPKFENEKYSKYNKNFKKKVSKNIKR